MYNNSIIYFFLGLSFSAMAFFLGILVGALIVHFDRKED